MKKNIKKSFLFIIFILGISMFVPKVFAERYFELSNYELNNSPYNIIGYNTEWLYDREVIRYDVFNTGKFSFDLKVYDLEAAKNYEVSLKSDYITDVRPYTGSAVMNGITGLTTAVSNGFANAEVSRCNGMTNILQALNNNQMNFTNQFNAIAMAQQQGMYNQTVATNDLKYTVATEGCADRAAVSDALRDVIAAQTASTQMILNQMNQDKLDAKNEQIQALQNQLYLANLTASQNAQTAAIIANNEAQTAALENYLSPPVRPAYLVANPNCCQNQWNGCGCGM